MYDITSGLGECVHNCVKCISSIKLYLNLRGEIQHMIFKFYLFIFLGLRAKLRRLSKHRIFGLKS